MRIVRFRAGRNTKYGIMKDNKIYGYKGQPFGRLKCPPDSFKADGTEYRLDQIKLLAPCTPSKIVCLGVNYHSHAQEFSHPVPSTPLIFLKPSTAVIGPEDKIVLPNSGRIDYECELAIVIGKLIKDAPLAVAADYILGYTCFNDVSDRTAQKQDEQWTRAKGYDTFAPMGPWIETELCPDDLLIETCLNGVCKQSSRTSHLIFGVPYLVSFISSVMTLLPGDVIATGTPSGVGPMHAGDMVEIKIEGVGTLTNRAVNKR
ncbi:MAG TPA: fumarylacetoacetate hydrolase family protein [Dehalococcoidia bacterium]|nr:fumarylacetoacetate hydrolase family protein [Dehalococcoidia bacterium]